MKKKTRLIITFSNVSAKIAKMTLLHKLYIVKDCITTHSADPSANTKIGIDDRFNQWSQKKNHIYLHNKKNTHYICRLNNRNLIKNK